MIPESKCKIVPIADFLEEISKITGVQVDDIEKMDTSEIHERVEGMGYGNRCGAGESLYQFLTPAQVRMRRKILFEKELKKYKIHKVEENV